MRFFGLIKHHIIAIIIIIINSMNPVPQGPRSNQPGRLNALNTSCATCESQGRWILSIKPWGNIIEYQCWGWEALVPSGMRRKLGNIWQWMRHDAFTSTGLNLEELRGANFISDGYGAAMVQIFSGHSPQFSKRIMRV